MTTRNPRINAVVDAQTYKAFMAILHKEGIRSASSKLNELIHDYVELKQDEEDEKIAEQRYKKYLKNRKAVSHDDFWGKTLGKKR